LAAANEKLVQECTMAQMKIEELTSRFQTEHNSNAAAAAALVEEKNSALLAKVQEELMLSSAEVRRLQEDLEKEIRNRVALSEQVSYFTSKVENMATLEGKLREKIRSLKSQRDEATAEGKTASDALDSLRAEHNELLSSQRSDQDNNDSNISSLVLQLSTLESEASELKEKCRTLEASLHAAEESSSLRTSFKVLMRVNDGQENWCLVSSVKEVDTESQEHGVADLRWFTESQCMDGWVKAHDTGAGVSSDAFSIDGEDQEELDLPPVLQDQLRGDFAIEREELSARVTALSEDALQSQQAFDTYRERAKQSLLKAAAEQRVSEGAAAVLREQAQELSSTIASQTKELTKLKEQHQQDAELWAGREAETEIEMKKLKEELAQAREDLAVAAIAEEQRLEKGAELESAYLESTAQANEWELKIEKLESDLNDKIEREKQLLAELKRKGDAARQLLVSKDSEIEALREKLKSAMTELKTPQTPSASTAADAAPTTTTKQEGTVTHTPSTNKMNLNHHQDESVQPRVLFSSSSETSIFTLDELEAIQQVRAQLLRTTAGQDHQPADTTTATPIPSDQQSVEQSFKMAVFNEELFKRAISREAELLDRLRVLKAEVQVLRSRQSLLSHTPRKKGGVPHTSSDSNIQQQANGENNGSSSSSAAAAVAKDEEEWEDSGSGSGSDGEREQRLMYLRQAFCGFFKAKQGMEMQNLARVMCAILGVSEEEQAEILESIERLVPALVATSTLESLSYNLTSFFS